MSGRRSTDPYTHDRVGDSFRALLGPARPDTDKGTPTAQLAQRARQVWASLSGGWRGLRRCAGAR